MTDAPTIARLGLSGVAVAETGSNAAACSRRPTSAPGSSTAPCSSCCRAQGRLV